MIIASKFMVSERAGSALARALKWRIEQLQWQHRRLVALDEILPGFGKQSVKDVLNLPSPISCGCGTSSSNRRIPRIQMWRKYLLVFVNARPKDQRVPNLDSIEK